MVYLGNKKMLEKEVNKNDLVSPVKGSSPAKGTGKPEKASKPMSTPLPRVMSVKPANSILDDLFALDGFSFGLAGVPTGQVSTITAKPTTEPDSFEALATAQAGFQNAGMPGTLSAQPDNPERVATAQAAGMVSGANGANDANNPFNVQAPSQKAKPEVPNMIVFEQPSRRAASLERLKKKLEAEQANQKEIAAARAAAEQAAAEQAAAEQAAAEQA